MKRVVVISDMHCGHEYGLTVPGAIEDKTAPDQEEYRRMLWDFFADKVTALQPIDYLVVNGDMVAGPNRRWGSRQLLTVDPEKQAMLAAAAIGYCRAGRVFMSYGTPYHTGDWMDVENLVAQEAGAIKIGANDNLAVEDVMFNYKHHIGGSSIPHGRFTAVAREKLWNNLWAEKGQVKADIIIRSHVHYFGFCGAEGWVAMTTPALQGLGDYFGARMVSGTVDFGLVSFDVEGGEFSWRAHLLDGRALLRKSF